MGKEVREFCLAKLKEFRKMEYGERYFPWPNDPIVWFDNNGNGKVPVLVLTSADKYVSNLDIVLTTGFAVNGNLLRRSDPGLLIDDENRHCLYKYDSSNANGVVETWFIRAIEIPSDLIPIVRDAVLGVRFWVTVKNSRNIPEADSWYKVTKDLRWARSTKDEYEQILKAINTGGQYSPASGTSTQF
jgi:hypothetical protein